MKIVIATSITPFVEGGSTYIVDWLGKKLEACGHEVDILRFPFSEDHAEVLQQLLAFRLLDLSEHGDRLISIRWPSHLLRHPKKVVWFIHHYRSAYDLWGTEYQSIPNTPEGIALRDAVIAADNVGLCEAYRVFCNSSVVKDRLEKFNSVDAEVLYPPLLSPELFYSAGSGDYLLYLGRLTRHKRQWLAIESLRLTTSRVRLVIAGQPEPGSEFYAEELQGLVTRNGLESRVEILARWIPEDEKRSLFANCLAVVYFPLDEDSYGYISLEACAASKPLLTTTDAGGVNELIIDGANGFVTPPDPELIAHGMDDLYNDRDAAREMGEAGQERIAELGINWARVLQRLLS
ncbi:MAG: glycosyltransferase family 4 protein [Bryobacteraceae bacterium]|jgi:glycosyltransferase involved in cell wall biosynthesis